MTSSEETHTIRHVFEGFVESGDLCDEIDGSSDLVQWHAIPPAGTEVMPFVLDALRRGNELFLRHEKDTA
jgi:hypothetical protein